jgi:hypothetical protein
MKQQFSKTHGIPHFCDNGKPLIVQSDKPSPRIPKNRPDIGAVQFTPLFLRPQMIQRWALGPAGGLLPTSFSEGICAESHPPPSALIN